MSFFNTIFNSSNDGVFIRRAQVNVGPLKESQWVGGVGPIAGFGEDEGTNQAVIFNSEGGNEDFRITFRAVKNIMALGAPNTLEVTLYNLTEQSKQILSREATNVLLQVGYLEGATKLQTVATGGITSVTSEREEGDIKTTMFSYDGMDGLAQSVSYKAYKGNTTLKNIVKALAEDIPGVESSDENIKIPSNIIVGTKGRVFAGRTSDHLDKLAREYGFNWSVQSGVFKVFLDTFIDGNTYEISTKASNLISATPRIDNIAQVVTTIDIETILDPRINPGDIVNLTSDINPTLNNRYQVTFISHVGDTHGDVWQSNIQCVLNDEARQQSFIATSANSPAQVTGG